MIELCNNCGAGLPCECGYVQRAPRNKPLPDNSLSEAFVQTPARADVEKLLSDALTNGKTWRLDESITGGKRPHIGSFLLAGPNDTRWMLYDDFDNDATVAHRPWWFGMLRDGHLTLVSAPGIQPTEDATQTGTKPEGAL